MAFKLADLVKDTTTTTGTGSYTISGTAATGYQAFLDRLGNGNQCCYCVKNGSDTEVGIGTLSGGTTLSRDVILESSNADAAVNWPAGTKDIFITLSAKLAVYLATPLTGAGDVGKLIKVAAGGLTFDLAAQGTGGGIDADKLDGQHGSYYNPITTRGDLIVGDATPKPSRFALGSSGSFLKAGATDPAWAALAASDIASGTLAIARLPVASAANIRAGSSSSVLIPPAALLSALGFSAYFISTAQTITSGGALTIAHGLARQPAFWGYFLVNQTAELGFSPGDLVDPGGWDYDSGGVNVSRGVAIVPDTTNLGIRYSSQTAAFNGMNFSSGAGVQFTNANWKAQFWCVA